MSQFTGLPYKATAQHSAVIHFRAGGNNEIITNHSVSDMYGSCHIAVYATIGQTARSANMTIVANPDIFNRPCIENHNMLSDTPDSGSMLVGIIIRNRLHTVYQLRTMAVQCQYISLMRRQFIINQHLTSPCFIKNRYFYPVAESRQLVYQNDIYIFDEGITANFVISYIILDIFNAAVIPHCYIVQCHMAQSRMFFDTSRQCKLRLEYAQLHFSRKAGMVNELTIKAFGNQNISPIISQTRLALQLKYLIFSQSTIVFHINKVLFILPLRRSDKENRYKGISERAILSLVDKLHFSVRPY